MFGLHLQNIQYRDKKGFLIHIQIGVLGIYEHRQEGIGCSNAHAIGSTGLGD
jgi:hypothetical protein